MVRHGTTSFVAPRSSFVASGFPRRSAFPTLSTLLYIDEQEDGMWRRLVDWYDDVDRERLAA